jgi:hypothetical protein
MNEDVNNELQSIPRAKMTNLYHEDTAEETAANYYLHQANPYTQPTSTLAPSATKNEASHQYFDPIPLSRKERWSYPPVTDEVYAGHLLREDESPNFS